MIVTMLTAVAVSAIICLCDCRTSIIATLVMIVAVLIMRFYIMTEPLMHVTLVVVMAVSAASLNIELFILLLTVPDTGN